MAPTQCLRAVYLLWVVFFILLCYKVSNLIQNLVFNFMKRNNIISGIFVFCLVFLVSSQTSAAVASIGNKMKGRILLQVQDHGEAWYIGLNGMKYYMGRPEDAFELMRSLGVGVTNQDLKKIEIAYSGFGGVDSDGDGLSNAIETAIGTNINNKDSDGDGYSDKEELTGKYNPTGTGRLGFDVAFAKKQAGKILLQVESRGEAWYISPLDNKRYFLGRPGDAFSVMRYLGVGASTNDIYRIPTDEVYQKKYEERLKNKVNKPSTPAVTPVVVNPVPVVVTPIEVSSALFNEKYQKKNSQVYYGDKQVAGADPLSLIALSLDYAKDKNYAYYHETRMPDADARTITPISADYANDKDFIYYHEQLIAGLDKPSFKIFNASYSRDKNFVYVAGRRDTSLDAATFQILNDFYAHDKNGFYFLNANQTVKISSLTAAESLTTMEHGFAKSANSVYYFGQKVEWAHPSSFVVLNKTYAYDSQSFFALGKKISKADFATFKVLDERIAKDAYRIYERGEVLYGYDAPSFVYYTADIMKDGRNVYILGKAINSADAKTFKYLGDNYSLDAFHAYYIDKVLSVNVASFEVLGHFFARDANSAFAYGDRIVGADAGSFRALNGVYSKDKNNVYVGAGRIDKADTDSFQILENELYGKDKSYVYFRGNIIYGADSASFKLLSDGYALDKNNAYYWEAKIENADPITFTVQKDGYAQDKNRKYFRGQGL